MMKCKCTCSVRTPITPFTATIYKTEDDDGNIKYYTTNLKFFEFCEKLGYDGGGKLTEHGFSASDGTKPDFKVDYTRIKESK